MLLTLSLFLAALLADLFWSCSTIGERVDIVPQVPQAHGLSACHKEALGLAGKNVQIEFRRRPVGVCGGFRATTRNPTLQSRPETRFRQAGQITYSVVLRRSNSKGPRSRTKAEPTIRLRH